jgi:hypothetical protein
MTCYIRIIQEKEQKRREEEQRKEQYKKRAEELKKERLEKEITKKIETMKKDEMEKNIIPLSSHTKSSSMNQRSRPKYKDYIRPQETGGFQGLTFTQKEKKESQISFVPIKGQKQQILKPKTQREIKTKGVARFEFDLEEEKKDLILEIEVGLPMFLSCGQKNILVKLKGKNKSNEKISAEIFATALDAKKRKINLNFEPKIATLEQEEEKNFLINFDLPENISHGTFTFSAYIQETTVYIDKPQKKSNEVLLNSTILVPMNLGYKGFEFEKINEETYLVIQFENLGEAGGIITTASKIKYGDEKEEIEAKLVNETKVKGKEKDIKLNFYPAKELNIKFLKISLFGTESTGKNYQQNYSISVKL